MSIGTDPATEFLSLTRDADFLDELVPLPGQVWPPGTTARVDLCDGPGLDAPVIDSWPATLITGQKIQWVIESAVCDEVTATHYRQYVCLPADVTGSGRMLDFCLFRGRIIRKD